MSSRAIGIGVAVAAMLVAQGAAPAGAANLFELNFYLPGPRFDGVLPPCDATGPLRKITERFSEKEQRFWDSALTIVGFERIRETAFRSWAPNTIPRRFCSGIAIVSDGHKHPIHYSIGEDTGWIGITWGVEWCVVGLDRNWSYNPGCKMARP
jgi:hypothetical protein